MCIFKHEMRMHTCSSVRQELPHRRVIDHREIILATGQCLPYPDTLSTSPIPLLELFRGGAIVALVPAFSNGGRMWGGAGDGSKLTQCQSCGRPGNCLGIACSLQGGSRTDGEGRLSSAHPCGQPSPTAHMKKHRRMPAALQLKSSASAS